MCAAQHLYLQTAVLKHFAQAGGYTLHSVRTKALHAWNTQLTVMCNMTQLLSNLHLIKLKINSASERTIANNFKEIVESFYRKHWTNGLQ